MAAVERGGILTTDNDVIVRATPSGPLVDPDAGTLVLTIKNPDGSTYATVPQNDLTRITQGHYSYEWAVPANLPVGDYPWNWNADVAGVSLPTAVNEITVVLAGQLGATFVSAPTVRALVSSRLSDADFAAVIAREEAMLAAEIGSLGGGRTDVFVVTGATASLPARLARTASSVSVTEDNVATTDIRLEPDGRTVTKLASAGWGAGTWSGVVEVTYNPNDSALVTTWVIELVRARLTETGFDSESDGTYTYSRGARSHAQTMRAAIAAILSSGGHGGGLRSVRMSTTAGRGVWIGAVRP